MARRKKKDQKLKVSVKFFTITIFILFFIFVAVNRIVYFFHHANIFNISEIIKSPSLQFVRSEHLDQLSGRNIFNVDLQRVQRLVQSKYPAIDRLKIVRQLPNRILVTAEKREPFAVISAGSQDVSISEDGVVLEMDAQYRGKLPYLSGINNGLSLVKGKRASGAQISVGLSIIEQVNANLYLREFGVTSIDLTNLSKIRLYLDNIEIIMDRSKVEQKIEILGLLFSDAGLPRGQINYVDLRFKEPTINRK